MLEFYHPCTLVADDRVYAALSEFPWYYDEKETCYILEGNAVVTDNKGNKIEFGPGDWVEFEQGLECNWKILKTIRKKYRFG